MQGLARLQNVKHPTSRGLKEVEVACSTCKKTENWRSGAGSKDWSAGVETWMAALASSSQSVTRWLMWEVRKGLEGAAGHEAGALSCLCRAGIQGSSSSLPAALLPSPNCPEAQLEFPCEKEGSPGVRDLW